jgi:uncharacterized protein YyaL (SSP411 family)
MPTPANNRLSEEVSPYLRQHRHNPVDWYPWGEAAFAEARRTGKPILLSVGYSACHWCHVMAHESFEDESTAEVMNALFVNVKVDREERPDVDHTYMAALHALGEQGGWPLTMFLDPAGRPFWGGTYFPNRPVYGRPAFQDVLRSVRHAYDQRPADIAQNAAAILRHITPDAAPQRTIVPAMLDNVATRIAAAYDPVNGGLRGAPKFPNPPMLELLWRAADRTGDESIREPLLKTLERMARGGIFDHIGGGFARYSVDAEWLVPHFEKMLYDNAQLLPLLTLAWRETGSPLFRHAAESTVVWLTRDMRTESGAFASSEDADSINPNGHAEEGAFYTFTPEEMRSILGTENSSFLAAYDITPHGNFEGRSIPNRLAETGLNDPAITEFAEARQRLLAARDQRPRPHRDDKVLADWNGLMIAGLTRAGMIADRADWIDLAAEAFTAVCQHLDGPQGLGHAWRAGKSVHPGFASDLTSMAVAALALYEATGASTYIADAARWAEDLQRSYRLPSGIFAMTVASADDLPIRPAPTQDDAVPNANALAAEMFIRLFGLTGESRWLSACDDLLAACSAAILANPAGHAALLNALDLRLRRADIAATGPEGDPLLLAATSIPYPNRTLRIGQGDRPQATICVDGRCSLPIAYPEQLLARFEQEMTPHPASAGQDGAPLP